MEWYIIVPWVRRLNIFKTPISPNWCIDATQSKLKSQKNLLGRNWQADCKIHMEYKQHKKQNNFEKEKQLDKVGKHYPIIRHNYKATILRTMWYWHQNKQTDQENRTELRNRCTYILTTSFQQMNKCNSVKKEWPL